MHGVRIVAALVVGTLALTATAAGTVAPYSPKRTAACLASHHVLAVTGLSQDQALVPPAIHPSSTILANFALVSGQELDHPTIAFFATPTTAAAARVKWLRVVKAAAAQVPGITLPDLRPLFLLQGNVVVLWSSMATKAATRRTVIGCLK